MEIIRAQVTAVTFKSTSLHPVNIRDFIQMLEHRLRHKAVLVIKHRHPLQSTSEEEEGLLYLQRAKYIL